MITACKRRLGYFFFNLIFFFFVKISNLKETQKRIRNATEAMKADSEDDKTSGKAELYFMAYELTEMKNSNDACIYENKEFWKFKPTISFNTIAVEIMNSTEQTEFILLKKFINLKEKLELVYYLPEIIKLVNKLQKYLSKTIFREYSSTKTLRSCLDAYLFQQRDSASSLSEAQLNQKLKTEFESHINMLQTVWSKCKHDLNGFVAKEMPNSRLTISNDHVFNLDTHLSYFLPSYYGDGFTCYALIKFLSSIHNNFLNEYLSQYKLRIETVQELDINLFENSEFIIQFNTKGNLLRLITSNYEYDSKNSKLIFHYEKIQRQLIENFIQSKPLINMKSFNKSIVFEYSEEMNDMEILIRLNNEIKQELLDEGTQKAIYDEFKQINETSEALHVLKTIINFACTTSNDKDIKLSDFVKVVYIQNNSVDTILKSRIIENCKLMHLKHIWLIVMMKRAVLFTVNDQESFEMLDDLFRKVIQDENQMVLKIASNSLTLVSIALVFYQLIVLFIYPLKSYDDKRIYSTFSLTDTILTIEDYDTRSLQVIFPSNTQPAYLTDIFPQTLKLENIYEIWKMIVQRLSKQL